MKIPSVTFGEVEIDPEQIYTFEDGIPGLKGMTQWVIIDRPELAPFKWAQACQPSHLSLMMLDPVFVDPNYHLNLSREAADQLGVVDLENDVKQLLVQSLIVVPKDPKEMTANLLAPLVFNPKTRKGMQVVVDGNRNLLRVKVIRET